MLLAINQSKVLSLGVTVSDKSRNDISNLGIERDLLFCLFMNHYIVFIVSCVSCARFIIVLILVMSVMTYVVWLPYVFFILVSLSSYRVRIWEKCEVGYH